MTNVKFVTTAGNVFSVTRNNDGTIEMMQCDNIGQPVSSPCFNHDGFGVTRDEETMSQIMQDKKHVVCVNRSE